MENRSPFVSLTSASSLHRKLLSTPLWNKTSLQSFTNTNNWTFTKAESNNVRTSDCEVCDSKAVNVVSQWLWTSAGIFSGRGKIF